MPAAASGKELTINLRVSQDKLDVIDTVASFVVETRTSFMLKAAQQAAEEILLDKAIFILNTEQWDEFNLALDTPPINNPGLRLLFATQSPWE
jgi:uncharacterized protein (DUF1778 family)